MWSPINKILPKKFLGIDIGTSYIKVVEIYKSGSRKKLENYGHLASTVLYEKPFRTFEKNTLLLSNEDVARAIRAIIEETKIKTKQAVFSIPDFSTFFTNFELPPMTKEELPQAVKYEARQHIPLPLSEVTLDWQIIESSPLGKGKIKFKILLVAVPNEVINQYQEIAKTAQLDLFALEAEVFSLMRSLVSEEEKRPVVLIDIGSQSTTCSIVDKKILRMSHSFDMSGNSFISTLSKGLSINYDYAQELIKECGIEGTGGEGANKGQTVREILLPLVDVILSEVKEILNNFYRQEKKEIEKVIIAGGTALMPGLKEYFSESLKIETEIANPFLDIFYPPLLEETLSEIGPGFAIATGAALRGMQN